ncbi:MAG: RNA methyltransferase [Clostridia bacterium]|nr:RNA methyltransferase [Clostridia bacterium]
MTINSTQNAKVKMLRALKTKKGRETYGCFCIEGVNLLKDLPSGTKVKELFIRQSDYAGLAFLEERLGLSAELIADGIFDSVCDTINPSGAIAYAEIPEYNNVEGSTVCLLCGISDAGNMGTIFRTAAARGIKTLLLYGDCVDVFSPKVIRAGMGGTFSVNAVAVDDGRLDGLLEEYTLVGLDAGGTPIYDHKRKEKTIIAVGSEAHGLPANIKMRCAEILSLPMTGAVESLNAAVSISIAMYLL